MVKILHQICLIPNGKPQPPEHMGFITKVHLPTQFKNDSVWGKLYNHYAVLDSRGLCPLGWRIPTDSDWNVLIKSLDPQADTAATTTVQTQSTTAGGSLKSNRNQPTSGGWNSPNTGATNLSGFSGLPSGYRTDGGTFNSAGNFGNWWSIS